ncbi:Ada metal-binding domain-containing protein [Fulvivirga kasyanovii]|uniref:Metal-binding protein n=2 Tax=Fulvivirga kasyanovii TaxID=396812 RepID=A0ABW9RUF5_9BACT|nr:metal-binding protein [Fulvivirga kasyanovii]
MMHIKVSVVRVILAGKICYAGNRRLKIYGMLDCACGKRMKMENRVFFACEREAVELGYRPCARCMKEKYASWSRKF